MKNLVIFITNRQILLYRHDFLNDTFILTILLPFCQGDRKNKFGDSHAPNYETTYSKNQHT
jgi:hypothetical protein